MNREKMHVRLAEAMEKRGLRAVDLIESVGIPKVSMSYYLSGKTEPKAERLYKIAKVLDVSEAWLLGFDVPMARTDDQKKNDLLAELVVQFRRNDELFGLVAKICALDAEQRELIGKLVDGLSTK